MMLKYIFILTSFFLLQSDVMEEISWNENYKLSWDDFKGSPNLDAAAVAVTASGLTFSYSIKQIEGKVLGFKTVVKAYFYPEHSWCKLDEVDAHVLGHEQLHFDITELHARIFRQQITTLKPHQDLVKTLKELHKKIEADLASMQKNYDTKSNYSINIEGQKKWKDSIALRLKALDGFKSKK